MNQLIGYVGTRQLGSMSEQDIRDLDGINIAFAHVEAGRVRWEHPECREGIARIRRIHPETKIVLSVGGWGAGGFSNAAHTQAGRQQFARDCRDLVKQYELDGIDIDWEYPCFSLAGIDADSSDKENFTLLLAQIRSELEALCPKRYLLTIAAGGDSYFVRNTRLAQAQRYLDYVQIMSYDLRGGFQLVTGHHTSLYAPSADLFDACTDKAVREFLAAGVPREKLVIGAAFYSREWEGVTDAAHGLCQQAKAAAHGHSYAELEKDFINKNGFTRYWDEEAKAPWLFNGDRFISYEDARSLSHKIDYLKKQGLLGIMFWVYGQDHPHSLLGHMRRELDGVKKEETMVHYRIPKPDISFQPPVYHCRRATKHFILDGNLEKEFWQDAKFTQDFADIEGDKREKPRFRTRAKMLWDDENLYIGAELEGNEIWGHQTERDCVIFQDNDFEIFIDPDSDTHQYYEFEMNAKNTVWDLLLTKTYRDGGKPVNGFDMHGMRSAVHIDGVLNDPSADNRRWMVEVVIPFSAVNECAKEQRSPVPGEFYRMNFSRVQWKVDVKDHAFVKRCDENGKVLPEDNWVWAPTGIVNIHYPELWGFVFFAQGSETYEIPQDEKDKWELRRLYYNANAYYDENGHFPERIEEIMDDYPYTIRPVYMPAKHTFEIVCDSKDGQRELAIQGDGRTYEYPIGNGR